MYFAKVFKEGKRVRGRCDVIDMCCLGKVDGSSGQWNDVTGRFVFCSRGFKVNRGLGTMIRSVMRFADRHESGVITKTGDWIFSCDSTLRYYSGVTSHSR
jgi:hypothetical protein